jgi:hypothetical protein
MSITFYSSLNRVISSMVSVAVDEDAHQPQVATVGRLGVYELIWRLQRRKVANSINLLPLCDRHALSPAVHARDTWLP